MIRPSEMRPGFDVNTTVVNVSPGARNSLAGADGNRVSLLLGHQSGADLWISTLMAKWGSLGYYFPEKPGIFLITFDNWGPAVGYEWFAESVAGGVDVIVTTVSWRGVDRR